MKLHIEALQEKLQISRRDVEKLNNLIATKIEEHSVIAERLNSMIKK